MHNTIFIASDAVTEVTAGRSLSKKTPEFVTLGIREGGFIAGLDITSSAEMWQRVADALATIGITPTMKD